MPVSVPVCSESQFGSDSSSQHDPGHQGGIPISPAGHLTTAGSPRLYRFVQPKDISSALLIVYLFVSTECLKCRIRMDFILPAVVHLCPHLTPRLQACQMDPRVRTRPR